MECYKWIRNNQLKNQPHKYEVYVRSTHKTKTSPFLFFLVLSLFGDLSNVLTNMEDLIINVVSPTKLRIGLSHMANALLQQHVETIYNNHGVSFYSDELRRVLKENNVMSDAASDAGSTGSTTPASDAMIRVDVPPWLVPTSFELLCALSVKHLRTVTYEGCHFLLEPYAQHLGEQSKRR